MLTTFKTIYDSRKPWGQNISIEAHLDAGYKPVVQVDVSNLQESINWYSHFGFEVSNENKSDTGCQLMFPVNRLLELRLNLNPNGVKPGNGAILMKVDSLITTSAFSTFAYTEKHDEFDPQPLYFFTDPDGNRLGLSETQKFSHGFLVNVSDMGKSTDWYSQVLGINRMEDRQPFNYRRDYSLPNLEHSSSRIRICFQKNPDGVEPGNRIIFFDVEQSHVSQARAFLLANDIDVSRIEMDFDRTFFFFTDPDGNRFGVRSDPNRDSPVLGDPNRKGPKVNPSLR